jgi:hypothetical protein
MIYHFSLHAAALMAGFFLVVISLPGVLMPESVRKIARQLPRSRPLGFALLTIDFIWSFWLLATMEMGEFSNFRRPLLIILPIGFILVLLFVDEFLAVRALGIFFLLAAEPLLDAAFFRNEASRLVLTVFAYAIIVKGLFYVMMPYLMRDGIQWGTRSNIRWRLLNSFTLLYGAALLALAFTRY